MKKSVYYFLKKCLRIFRLKIGFSNLGLNPIKKHNSEFNKDKLSRNI